MDKIIKLQKEKAEKIKRMEELLLISESEEKGLTEEQNSEFQNLKEEIKAMTERIKDLEFIEQNRVKQINAQPETTIVKTEEKEKTGVVSVSGKLEKGHLTASWIRTLAASKHFGVNALDWAKKAYGENHPVVKTLLAGSGAGSNTIPSDVASEIIELLRNNTIIRQMGPRAIGMEHGTLDITRQTGSVTASYVGENTALNATDMTADQVSLALKKIMAVTSVSKELLSDSVHNVDSLIRDDLVEALRDAENAQLIRGTGSATAPNSLYEFADNASQVHSTAAGAAPNVTAVELVLKTLVQFLEAGNVSVEGAFWGMSSRTKNYLMFLRDTNGNRAFPEMRDGMLLDQKFLVTEAIPSNLGVGTDESELYLVQPKGLYLADGSQMNIESTDVGSYQVGGALKSAFADDSVAFKVTQRHDFEARHAKAVACAEGVQWGD